MSASYCEEGGVPLLQVEVGALVEMSVPAVFEERATTMGERPAVRLGGETLSYAKLNQWANGIARAIIDRCEQPGRPVAVLMDKRLGLFAAMMGVLKSTMIYVPVDVAYPEERRRAILEDVQPALVVGNGPPRCEVTDSGLPFLDLGDVAGDAPCENPGVAITADDLGCIVYTSGSTGRPKGVTQNHRNMLHAAALYARSLNLTPADRVACPSSHAFWGFIRPALGTLLTGATFLPMQLSELDRMGQFLWDEGGTVFHAPSSAFRHLLHSLAGSPDLPSLTRFYGGGEPLYATDVARWRRLFPRTTLLHVLGMTEADTARQFLLDAQTSFTGDVVPLGYPVEGAEVLVLDENGSPLPTGKVGQIAVVSRYLSPGYWRRPDLTDAVFGAAPDGEGRMYLTGDRGRLGDDGCLEHLGRVDNQVKVRGHRVELDGVQRAIRQTVGIRDAVVVHRAAGDGSHQLVAYVVFRDCVCLTEKELRRRLAERLPGYMVPSAFVVMPRLPLTPNAKIDYDALPAPDSMREPAVGDAREATTTAQRIVQSLFEEVLGSRGFGLRDSFFDVGGDSLRAASVLARIEATTGVRCGVDTFYADPTVHGLAEVVEGRGAPGRVPVVVPVQPLGTSPPLFMVSPAFGWFFSELARELGTQQPVYALNALALVGEGADALEVQSLAERFIVEVRKIRPRGPYCIGGLSAGGAVAYEMARRLTEAGEAVGPVFLVDTPTRPPAVAAYWGMAAGLNRHLGRARQGAWRAKAALCAGAVKALGSWFRHRVRRLLGKVDRDVVQHRNRLQGRVRALIRAHRRAARRYRPRPFPGRVVQFLSEEMLILALRDPRLGWRRLAHGGFSVHRVPGYHHEVILPPNVHEVARIIESCLEETWHLPDTSGARLH